MTFLFNHLAARPSLTIALVFAMVVVVAVIGEPF